MSVKVLTLVALVGIIAALVTSIFPATIIENVYADDDEHDEGKDDGSDDHEGKDDGSDDHEGKDDGSDDHEGKEDDHEDGKSDSKTGDDLGNEQVIVCSGFAVCIGSQENAKDSSDTSLVDASANNIPIQLALPL
jgi:hypothetical protein